MKAFAIKRKYAMHNLYLKTAIISVAVALLLLLAACSSPGVPSTGARLSSNALTNAQPTNTPQTASSSILSLTVQPYPLPYTIYELGSDMSHQLATGIDYEGPGDPITATIDWGDHTTPTQYTFIDGRDFQISAGHAYSKLGKYTITVTAAITIFQQSVSETGVINVVPAYTLNVNNRKPTVMQAFSGTIATGTDPFANDPLKGTINWGDGTALTNVQVTSSAQGNFQLQATHTYNQVGNFTITVELNSIIVGPVMGTGTAMVPPTFTLSANNIQVHAGRPFQSIVGTVTGTVSSAGLRVNIEWGDNTVSKMTMDGGKGKLKINGSHNYSQAGTYTITIIIEDIGTKEQTYAKGTVTVI